MALPMVSTATVLLYQLLAGSQALFEIYFEGRGRRIQRIFSEAGCYGCLEEPAGSGCVVTVGLPVSTAALLGAITIYLSKKRAVSAKPAADR